jgi:hypothetical protein
MIYVALCPDNAIVGGFSGGLALYLLRDLRHGVYESARPPR